MNTKSNHSHTPTPPHSDTPIRRHSDTMPEPPRLALFTQPNILKTIGPIRVAKFFQGFDQDLKIGHPDLLATIKPQPGSDEPSVDFSALADLLARPQSLPDQLRL